jgi:hypothetical protein
MYSHECIFQERFIAINKLCYAFLNVMKHRIDHAMINAIRSLSNGAVFTNDDSIA